MTSGRRCKVSRIALALVSGLVGLQRSCLFAVLGTGFFALLVLGTSPAGAQTSKPIPDYVGSKACVGCHATIAEAWQGSHHAWAWKSPNESTVLGDFADKTFKHAGIVSRLTKMVDKFFVTTEGSDGDLRRFEVVGTVGVAPLQQYLVETQSRRLQALDIAWDAERARWYHLYPNQDLPHDNGLHWTGPYKNWNARCAECHATGFEKRYAPLTRRYASVQVEKGVGCEACHGPGSAHLAWARDKNAFDPASWRNVGEVGFSVKFSPQNAAAEIQQCAGCHARREPLGDASPLPGTPFADSYRLALLREGLYHSDGQIKDEVYVYGSFLQSKMYDRGVRCSDCHEPHSAALRADGNGVCTQCHGPAGNSRFPTLKQGSYDSPDHHFHQPGTDAPQCKSCHMIERVYMGIDGRRDHSFRIPRPDLSMALGTPNACLDCHEDKSPAWAAKHVENRFPNSERRGAHFARPFAAARRGTYDTETVNALLDIALSPKYAAIVRATALQLLNRSPSPRIANRVSGLLREANPQIRATAVEVQRALPLRERLKRIEPLLNDDRKSVRIAAVRTILDVLAAGIRPGLQGSVRVAVREYQRSLTAKADFPETQMAIAGTALVFRDYRVAERAFSEAARMDPQLVQAWRMSARFRAARNDFEGAKKLLLEGLAANPNNPVLKRLLVELSQAPRSK